MIADKITMVIGLILGLAIGFGGGYLTKALIDKIEMAELRSERDQAVLARQTMQEQWEEAVNELSATKIILNDTLAALELLREYQRIDDETRKDIDNLKKTLDPEGKPTPQTEDLFRSLVDEFNRLNGITNAINVGMYEPLDLEPFKQLRSEAEKLYKETQNLVFELGLGG